MQPNPANDNRPAEFDARVMAYLPGLRKLAARYKPLPYREDLVTDTIMFALEKWQNFREDGGLWNWLAWTMRGIVSNGAATAARQRRQAMFVPIGDTDEDFYAALSTPATQERALVASDALSRLSTIRHGDVLVRRAMGDTLAEIGRERGVSHERVRQIEEKARAAFMKVAA